MIEFLLVELKKRRRTAATANTVIFLKNISQWIIYFFIGNNNLTLGKHKMWNFWSKKNTYLTQFCPIIDFWMKKSFFSLKNIYLLKYIFQRTLNPLKPNWNVLLRMKVVGLGNFKKKFCSNPGLEGILRRPPSKSNKSIIISTRLTYTKLHQINYQTHISYVHIQFKSYQTILPI